MASRKREQDFAPWTPAAVGFWAALSLLAAIVLLVCWYHASGQTQYNDQKSSINLAILAVVLIDAVGAFLCLTGRRAVGMRRQLLLADIPVALLSRSVTKADGVLLTLVGGAGLKHFHRSDCALATGRDWAAADRSVHEQEGRTPCGVCRP
jgi:ABC-type nickel/cobalt efflux system permease component RcnA